MDSGGLVVVTGGGDVGLLELDLWVMEGWWRLMLVCLRVRVLRPKKN